MRAAVLAAALVLAAASAARALDADVQAYDEARRRGATGSVDGRVYYERSKPAAADVALAGAVVVALPRSESLMARLDALRAGARESSAAYRDAAAQMRRARETYEKELWEAGAAELVRSTVVDREGRFGLADLPAGRWIVWATHSAFAETPSPKAQPRERERFVLPPRLLGYYAQRVWLREVDVGPGPATPLELTDRNVWFTGVVEDRVRDAGPSR